MSIGESKRELRAEMSRVRSEISGESRSAQSLAACMHAEHEVIGPLRNKRDSGLTVFTYLSFRDEPDTRPLLRSCLERGDTVLVPRVTGDGIMTLHRIGGEEDLAPGTWGILEPGEEVPIWPASRYGEIDLAIVPGLAYDRWGGRIGFGGGYYDRFMAEWATWSEREAKRTGFALKAALAFREQIVSGLIPMEEHDFRLDMLFTATGTIYIEGK
ncbi:5-formyltetrahydrofolate cyclo-ligase [Paenibacillus sp. Marseille-P2973]|uniref:5-formyltetrahydrofolate cyclo-ligase n=1 Tax=Paenibacillus sp. Marseille-P2973 TaxID=1871032 RepID=UPI001B377C25|nr:5-formyltetrahydrofolate cyclo-ligase [Paenibacillus sp. Marseille-P2973]MBQ4899226.1 5-formyltetrahydrofolate cyclo-ligase [Paenibacillus sp. Marseille-P2973]